MGAGASGAICCTDDQSAYRRTAMSIGREQPTKGLGIVVVTGANGSLGKHTCAGLYAAGATVIMAGRSTARIEAARDEVRAMVEANGGSRGGSLEIAALDLGDYESIKIFIESLQGRSIYALVNNAGIHPGSEYQEGKYGMERSFQVNLLGTAALTELMLPLLTAPGARVVSVCSLSHRDAPPRIAFDEMPTDAASFGGYDREYCYAKWFLTAYTLHLNERLASSGSSIKAVCSDPGISPESPMWDEQPCCLRLMVRCLCKCLTHSPPQGAATSVYCAAVEQQQLHGGTYYTNCTANPEGSGLPRPDAADPKMQARTLEMLSRLVPSDVATFGA